jgi:Ni/Fe-hydrogenase 1 B-type cytochrome subunit
MDKNKLTRIYVWEIPVRIYHWINALVTTLLVITGFIIANPPVILTAKEAPNAYWFGVTRFIHFAAAYIFIFNLLYRIIFSFFGNEYANVREYLIKPFTKGFWRKFRHVLQIDILLLRRKPYIDIGHNPVAVLSYIGLFVVSFIQAFTGLGLMADTSTWWFAQWFGFVPDWMGGDIYVRFLHHVTTWFFILFFIIHFYLVLFHEWFEGRGVLSSMTSGLKFFEDWVMDVLRKRKREGTKL